MDADDEPLTHAIIGAAFEVHRTFGPGFLEGVYHDALAIEFEERGIDFTREFPIPIAYKGRTLGTPYRADFVCSEVVVELKAIGFLSRVEENQVVHYLRATGLAVGLLMNFGSTSLQVRRLGNSRSKKSSESPKSNQSPIDRAFEAEAALPFP